MSLLKDVIGYGTHAARPAAGSEGRLYYETDTSTLFRDTGTTWVALPLGSGALSLASDKKVRTSGDITGFVSTTFAPLDSALDITLATGARRCLIGWALNGKNSTTAALCIDISVDGTREGGVYGLALPGASFGEQNLCFSGSYLSDVLTEGSHTFELQGRVDAGSATIYASSAISPLVFWAMEQPS